MKNDLESIATTLVFKVVGHPVIINGFLHGLRQPSMVVLLVINARNCQEWLNRVDQELSVLLKEPPGKNVSPLPVSGYSEQVHAVQSLLFWMGRLQESAGAPVYEAGKIIDIYPETSSVMIAIPTWSSSHPATGQLFFWLMNVFDVLSAGRNIYSSVQKFPAILKQMAQTVPHASNMPRFLRAAFDAGIPCYKIAGEVYQFGYGARSRWLDSSFTDQTSQIGTRLARVKTLAAKVLRSAGIPVPDHIMVSDVNGAEKAAFVLGFPVVVKPADMDGGVGVAAGLTTPEEVRKAFADAQKKSQNILVEKHHDGSDYRLTVFQGELIWAVERVPGGLTGDGISSVKNLLDRLNADPRRGDGHRSPLRRIILDDEAKSLLSKAGIGLNSVPREGEFVRLRSRANVACGGMPVAVFEQVHPDNTLLAVRAAAALRLDFAGVDLLIPDIRHSWRDSGAVVCEVNAQPSLGGITSIHLYLQLLRWLVQGSGRIPVAVIIGAPPEWNLAAAIADRLSLVGLVTGRGDHEGVSIGTASLTAGGLDLYTGGRMLMGEKGVDAMVFCINDASVLRTGLPFERFDLLVVAGSHLLRQPLLGEISEAVQLRTLFDVLSRSCDGKVILAAGSGLEVHGLPDSSSAEFLREPVEQRRLVVTIAEAMIAAEGNYSIEQPA